MRYTTLAVLACTTLSCSAREQPTTAPAVAAPEMRYRLSVEPGTLYHQEVPSAEGGPRTAVFQFIVDNPTKQVFTGEAPTSAIVRINVSDGEKTIWEGPEIALQVITPVQIRANDILQHSVSWEIPDITQIPLGELQVTGTFVPTGGRATTVLKIRRRM